MTRRYRRSDGGEVRRMMMALWCRIRMGEDSWSDGWADVLTVAVLLAMAAFAMGFIMGGTAQGDLIMHVESVGARVYAGHDVAVELPYELGYLTFGQTETHEGVDVSGLATIGVGPAWAGGLIGTGVALGSISIQVVDIFVQGWPRVVWDGFGRQIGYSEQAAEDGVLWGGGGPLPDWIAGDADPDGDEDPVIIAFQWERFAIPGVREAAQGNGWVSLTHIGQMVPVVDPVTGVDWLTGSGYTVEAFALAQLDVGLRSGEPPEGWGGGGGGGAGGGGSGSGSGSGSGGGGIAVPEPGGIGGMLAAAAVAAGWGLRQRRRMQGQGQGQGEG